MRKQIKGMPFEVAVACGYVPGRPQPWWRKWKNRLLLKLFPNNPPRVNSVQPTTSTLVSTEPVDFTPGWPEEMNLSKSKREYLESEGVNIAAIERINQVLNQTPEEVAAYWEKYWAEHDGKNVDKAVKPVVFGKSKRSEAEAVADLMSLQAKAEKSYQQEKPVDPSLSKAFDDAGFPRVPGHKYSDEHQVPELPKGTQPEPGEGQTDQGQKGQ